MADGPAASAALLLAGDIWPASARRSAPSTPPGTTARAATASPEPGARERSMQALLDALTTLIAPNGDDPTDPANGGTDHPLCPRGLFFTDEARNLYEAISPA
ncbi:hypothetical protein GCM10023205_03780 [Yinghuangia aomiensis]|uniref:Uncharacterized protein n=1 Tax=Yinghuangia aomiensis TaxID=676205 RepID=A0ABP9GL80_9ACTN